MTTLKRRINISLSKSLDESLVRLSDFDQVPVATKAVELLQLAVEIEEDQVWNKMALNRDTARAKFVSHKKVWA